jgi:transcriptional regulator
MSPARIFYHDDLPRMLELVRSRLFGELITVGPSGPLVTAVPMLVKERPEGLVVEGHLVRSNPQVRESDLARSAVAVFAGPEGYISPTWYVSTSEDQAHVPTWDYCRVELEGELLLTDDPEELRAIVTRLTEWFEPEGGYRPELSPPDYLERQLGAIVGFKLVVRERRGIAKLSQNRPEEDRRAVVRALAERGDDELAKAVFEELER